MRLSTAKLALLGMLICLPSTGFARKKKEPMRPLRLPFSLFPGLSPSDVNAMLVSKGITHGKVSSAVGAEEMMTWPLKGQIAYGDFTPQSLVATFQDQKLASIALIQSPLEGCGEAQPVYVSALAFTRDNYDQKDAPIRQEPATEILDCGPHFKPESYELQRENKKLVLITAFKPIGPHRLAVGITYYDREYFKPIDKDTPTLPSDPKTIPQSKTTQSNL
jgi:hypothetical protein